MEEKQFKNAKKKLIIIFSLAMFAWIIFCIFWGIQICKKEEKKQIEMTVPVQINHDTIVHYPALHVNDSMVVFDSLGIKIVGYNIK